MQNDWCKILHCLLQRKFSEITQSDWYKILQLLVITEIFKCRSNSNTTLADSCRIHQNWKIHLPCNKLQIKQTANSFNKKIIKRLSWYLLALQHLLWHLVFGNPYFASHWRLPSISLLQHACQYLSLQGISIPSSLPPPQALLEILNGSFGTVTSSRKNLIKIRQNVKLLVRNGDCSETRVLRNWSS